MIDRDRVALFAMPVLAGVATTLVMLGPGADRTVNGVRVHGYPTAASRQLALRIETLAHGDGQYRSADFPLTVELRCAASTRSTPLTWQGASQAGFAEVSLGLPAEGCDDALLVVNSGGETLLTGRLAEQPALAELPPLKVAVGEGDLKLAMMVPRGVAVPDFAEEVIVEITHPRGAEPRLSVDAAGADVVASGEPSRVCEEVCVARHQLALTARALTATLTLEAVLETAGDEPGALTKVRWEGPIPVEPGGLFLGVSDAGWSLAASSPRDAAFVSVYGAEGRSFGARVAMTTDAQGYARGFLDAAALPALGDGPSVAVVSTSPSEPAETSIAWPLRPERGSREAPSLVTLADSMPAAIEGEERRRWTIRAFVFFGVLVTGLFEIALLLQLTRKSAAKLEAHMRAEGGKDVTQRTPLWWVVVALGAVALAFVALATLAAFKS